MTAINIGNLVKRYKNGVVALNGLTLSVQQGEIFSLLGPNGAGKSSLLNILSTYYVPTSGKVEVLGKDIYKQAGDIRKRITCVAQKISIDEHLSLLENMWFQSRLYKVDRREARGRIDSLIQSFGLGNYLKYPVISYSGGVKRRLDIAMNMVSMPEILFLDEPTVGLDVESRRVMWDIVRTIRRDYNTTIFLTTHYLEEADQLSDTICIMKDGKEIEQGTPEELKSYTSQNTIKIGFGRERICQEVCQKLQGHEGILSLQQDKTAVLVFVDDKIRRLREINRWLLEQQIEFHGLEIMQPSLEEVFITMMEQQEKESGSC